MKRNTFGLLLFMIVGLFGMFQNVTAKIVSPLIIKVNTNDLNPLAQAHTSVKAALALEDTPVIVEFKAGTYYAQSIKWLALPKNYPITFRPEKGSENQVIFDGRISAEEAARGNKGKAVALFTFQPDQLGKYSNITVDNITVRYYLEGINFLANRDDRNLFIGNNKILNSSFINIGNLYAEIFTKTGELSYGLAVIRLLNSRDGIFKGNRFENINNLRGAGQHAFYIAHHSENNLIEGNVFLNHKTGSVVKLRDQSHNNKIISNLFNGFHPNAIQVWHCDANETTNASGDTRGFRSGTNKDNPTACTKFNYDLNSNFFSNTECFSYSIEERGNSFLNDGKQALFDKKINVYQNANAFCGLPDPTKPIINSDKNDYLGVLISSLVGSDLKYAICSSSKDCTNTTNSCYNDGTGSAHLICENNLWISCNESNLKKISGNKICLYSKDKKDTAWVEIPKNSYFIESEMKGSVFQGFCSQPSSCLNSKSQCRNHMAHSPHQLCMNQKWQDCSVAKIQKAAGQPILRGDTTSGIKACKLNVDGLDAAWVTLPAGQFYISSFIGSMWKYAFSATRDSCVASSGTIYANDRGTSHYWCEKNAWIMCNLTKVGLKSGSRTCTKVSTAGVADYQWK